MLLPNASILLTACLTGKYELFNTYENQSYRSLLIRNMNINNFGILDKNTTDITLDTDIELGTKTFCFSASIVT